MHCSDGFKTQRIAGTWLRTLGNHSTPGMICGQNTKITQSFIGGHIEKNFVLVT